MENLNHKFNNFGLKSKPLNNLNTLDDFVKKFQNSNIYNTTDISKQTLQKPQIEPMKIDNPHNKKPNLVQQKQICKPRHKSKLKPIIYMNVDVEPGMCQGISFINKKINMKSIKNKNLMLHAYKIKFMINNIQYNFKARYTKEFEEFLRKQF